MEKTANVEHNQQAKPLFLTKIQETMNKKKNLILILPHSVTPRLSFRRLTYWG